MKINVLAPTLVLGAMLSLPSSAYAFDYIIKATCNVVDVAAFPNRAHFRCDNMYPAYFAVPTSSSAEATRLVTLASAALLGDRKIEVTYNEMDAAPETYGCMHYDCRRPIQLRLIK